LLGVKAVIAKSFERIHRSNLIGMGVLACQFKNGESAESLGIKGDESFDVTGLEAGIKPQMDVTLTITRKDGSKKSTQVLLRIDTPIEVDYYLHGGILPFVLRELISQAA
jgi:aconitate hydratase